MNADDLPRTELVNSTTLTHTRLGSSGTLVFVSYIIEFTDNTTVKRASLSFASGDMSLRDTLGTALNDSSSIVNGPGNFGRQGSTNFASSDNMGYGWFAYDLLNDSVVEVSRANTGSAATAPYEAVSFRYDQTRAPNFSDANPVGPYDDAQVRSIQRGSVSLGSGASVLNVAITSVDLTKSFLVFESSTNDADPSDFNVSGQLSTSTNIQFQRTGTGPPVNLTYKVIEFFGDVTVQRGATTLSSTTQNQAITSVDLDKSFVLFSLRFAGGSMSADDFAVADLTTGTNMQFRANGTGATIEWQVIEYDDSYVRKVKTALGAGQTTKTVDINECGSNYVDQAKTMILGSQAVSTDVRPDDLPRYELTDSTELTITRVGSTADLEIVVYVVEFLDSTTVQSGTTDLTG